MNQSEAQAVMHALALLNEARKAREMKHPEAMVLEFQAREILARLVADQEPDKDRLR